MNMGTPFLHIQYALKILNGLAQTNKQTRERSVRFWAFDTVRNDHLFSHLVSVPSIYPEDVLPSQPLASLVKQ